MADDFADRDLPPRLEPLKVEEMSDELLDIVRRMADVNAAIAARQRELLTDVLEGDPAAAETYLATIPEIISTLLRHPKLFARLTDVGIELLGRGALDPRDRELAILRGAWLCQAPYEWGEHVLVGKSVGLTSEEIERVTEGSSAPGWTEHEAAILRAVEELRSTAQITDETWATLEKRLDERQLIELPILIGQYQLVAYYQNALRLRLHDGNEGLSAR